MGFVMVNSAPVGNAVAADVLDPATFSSAAAGSGVAGTMPNNGSPTYNPSTSAQAIAAGYYSGGTVAAVTGTATAADVLSGSTFASAAGIGLTGSTPNNGAPPPQPGAAIAAGYYSGGSAAAVKVATGTVTSNTNAYTYTTVSGTALLSPVSVPVPSGASTIIAVLLRPESSPAVSFGCPTGYADSLNASCTDVDDYANPASSLINQVPPSGSPTGIQINASAIDMAAHYANTVYYYTVIYT